MSSSEILGTLVVVVLKARNLPDKSTFGKQNPYVTVSYGLNKKKTPAIPRGGQAPEWDAEFRFEIARDGTKDELAAAAATVGKTGGVMPVNAGEPTKGQGTPVKAPGGKRILNLACYADDPKDPRLVGEAALDIEPTIKRGNFDEWVHLERKGRYAGELYLEMTWYYTDIPTSKPLKKTTTNASASNYGGSGSRVADEEINHSTLRHSTSQQQVQAWNVDNRAGGTSSRTSANNSFTVQPIHIPEQYPDADMAPLTKRLSTMSFRPLPQPGQISTSLEPSNFDSSLVHQPPNYNMLSPGLGPPPENAYPQRPYDERRSSYNGPQQQQPPSLSNQERRSSYTGPYSLSPEPSIPQLAPHAASTPNRQQYSSLPAPPVTQLPQTHGYNRQPSPGQAELRRFEQSPQPSYSPAHLSYTAYSSAPTGSSHPAHQVYHADPYSSVQSHPPLPLPHSLPPPPPPPLPPAPQMGQQPVYYINGPPQAPQPPIMHPHHHHPQQSSSAYEQQGRAPSRPQEYYTSGGPPLLPATYDNHAYPVHQPNHQEYVYSNQMPQKQMYQYTQPPQLPPPPPPPVPPHFQEVPQHMYHPGYAPATVQNGQFFQPPPSGTYSYRPPDPTAPYNPYT